MKKAQVSLEFIITLSIVLILLVVMGVVIHQKNAEITAINIDVQGKRVTDSIADNINEIYTVGDGYSTTFSLPENLYGDTGYMVAFYRDEPRVSVETDNGFSWSRPLATHEICCGASLCNCTENSTECFFRANKNTTDIKARNRNGVVIVGENPLVTFNLTLVPGWNGISLPIEPENNSVEAIFGNISNMTEVLYYKSWEMAAFGNPSAYISARTLELDKEYHVNFTGNQNTTITITGRRVCEPCCINRVMLHHGVNAVGWTSLRTINITDALSSIEGSYDIVRTIGPGHYLYYVPSFGPSQFNTIEPGRGYQIYVNATEPLLWQYNPC